MKEIREKKSRKKSKKGERGEKRGKRGRERGKKREEQGRKSLNFVILKLRKLQKVTRKNCK